MSTIWQVVLFRQTKDILTKLTANNALVSDACAAALRAFCSAAQRGL